MTNIRREISRALSAGLAALGPGGEGVVEFLNRCRLPDGYADRAGKADLYYTVFGLDVARACSAAASADWLANFRQHLATYGDGAGLDFVHACCLARCWAAVDAPAANRDALTATLLSWRSADGGFAPTPQAERGTAYGGFLAACALEDLGAAIPNPAGLIASVELLKCGDGGFANDSRCGVPTTPSTAAAVILLHHLGCDVDPVSADWLVARFAEQGGAAAAAGVPICDLLSTAVALHALATIGRDLPESLREATRKFVASMHQPGGGFCGSVADATCDCEYTFYGLLAMGNLGGGHES